MTLSKNKITSWSSCVKCKGLGKIKRRIKKNVRLRYQFELDEFEKSGGKGNSPVPPAAHLDSCKLCNGSGLTIAEKNPTPEINNFPHIAIIGAGIGGVALAVACLHRKIPFTLYERDSSFDERSQGYGLTLQQASSAIKGLGITELESGIVSTKHLVHTPEGKVIGEWGMRKWLESDESNVLKKTNIHIARQSLRSSLLNQLGTLNSVEWGHRFIKLNEKKDKTFELNFEVNGIVKTKKADLVVGADGIRSSVRNLLYKTLNSPLNYLGCIVILGICRLDSLQEIESPLLDSATVFQTVNGNERIYIMPYDSNSIMWQFSFPLSQEEAKKYSDEGPVKLKKETIKRAQWHDPIPQILKATPLDLISGYPVYDREILKPNFFPNAITLLGDAAHPMSPFKGQGANQAILDALSLARGISKKCNPKSNWRETGIRSSVLNDFETEMMDRTLIKVKESAAASKLLHSEAVLTEINEPRGRILKEI
jgi:2-polyprenyl-6-methoxyphenol hydroxylase-like FAD-dependent oxidoreductase